MSKAKTVKEVLIAARWILENIGWCQDASAKRENGTSIQGSFFIEPGHCYCASGAIDIIDTHHNSLKSHAARLVDEAARSLTGLSIIACNDMPGRTKKKMLEVFDLAIKKAYNV